MSEQCPQCGSIIRRLDDGTLERSQGTVSRAYVAQDENGGWYGDAGNVMQESDPERTKEQAQEWVIERLNAVAERPCLIYTDYREWLREAHRAKRALSETQAEVERLRAVANAVQARIKHTGECDFCAGEWAWGVVDTFRHDPDCLLAALQVPATGKGEG